MFVTGLVLALLEPSLHFGLRLSVHFQIGIGLAYMGASWACNLDLRLPFAVQLAIPFSFGDPTISPCHGLPSASLLIIWELLQLSSISACTSNPLLHSGMLEIDYRST